MISFAKKFLSIALALVLLVGMFPMAALAAGNPVLELYTQIGNDKGTRAPVMDGSEQRTIEWTDPVTYEALEGSAPAKPGYTLSKITWGNGHEVAGETLEQNRGLVFVYEAVAAPEKVIVTPMFRIDAGSPKKTKQGGIEMDKGTALAAVMLTLPTPAEFPELTGKKFVHWVHEDGTLVNNVNINEDVNVYADFITPAVEPAKHTIEIYTKNLDDAVPERKATGKTFLVDPGYILTKEVLNTKLIAPAGTKIVNWTYGNGNPLDGKGITDNRGVIAELRNLPAAKTYTVNAYREDGTLIKTFTDVAGDTLLSDLLKGYAPNDVPNKEFKEWLIEKSAAIDGYKVNSNINVYAMMTKLAGVHTVTVKGHDPIYVAHNTKIAASDLADRETSYHVDWKFTAPADMVGKDVDTALIKSDCTIEEVLRDAGGVMEYDVTFYVTDANGVPYEKYRDQYGNKRQIRNGMRMGDIFPDMDDRLPKPILQNFVFEDWVECDQNGKILENARPFNTKTTFNESRDIYLVSTWTKEAKVNLHVFRNGETRPGHEYTIISIPGLKVNQKVDVSSIDGLKIYKNSHPANATIKGYKGLFNEELWRDFRLDGDAKPLQGFITVGDPSTNNSDLYCMVYDNGTGSNAKPDSSNPKTGDENMIFATTAVMLISAGALAVFFMDKKRRNG